MVTVLVILLVIILLIAGGVFAWFVSTQRSLVVLDENCKNSLSQIEVQLNSRWDALMQLSRQAEKAGMIEAKAMIETIKARRPLVPNSAQSINENEGQLNQLFSRLMMLGEQYPQFRSMPLFAKSMESISSYEENVRISRMVYNDTTTKFNRAIRQWPGSFVASMLHFTERDYLKIDNEQKRDIGNYYSEQKDTPIPTF
ncbi:MAG: LemA family protein [Prevotella sp.]|jgi:LemA protein|nr:LemA family protein [Prevotella sp.]MBP3743989.1 LemA family protein [Prevotella sp.]MBQ1854503.1 LemA family protein [Prevotella sp.]MBQ2059719.1 LemA family protein [Prevotella sp.]MBQ2338543.1 LemA family protein [Prevotella sp.]